MPWPCPSCSEPFEYNHMCPELKAKLIAPGAQHTWPWLARTLMLELHLAQQAFLVEQSLGRLADCY
jgi:hypothetical protein